MWVQAERHPEPPKGPTMTTPTNSTTATLNLVPSGRPTADTNPADTARIVIMLENLYGDEADDFTFRGLTIAEWQSKV